MLSLGERRLRIRDLQRRGDPFLVAELGEAQRLSGLIDVLGRRLHSLYCVRHREDRLLHIQGDCLAHLVLCDDRALYLSLGLPNTGPSQPALQDGKGEGCDGVPLDGSGLECAAIRGGVGIQTEGE